MLDGARDADGDIEVRRHHLAGLAHLVVVGDEAGVHRRPGGAHRAPELVRDLLEKRKLLAALHAPPARDDDPRAGQFGPLGLGKLVADEAGKSRVLGRRDVLDGGVAAVGRRRVEGGPAHGDHLDGIGASHRGQGVAGVDRADEGVRPLDADDVGDLRHVEQRRHPRHEVLAERGGGRQQVAVGGRQSGDQGRQALGQGVGVDLRVGEQHVGDPGHPGRGLGDGAAVGAGHQHAHLAQFAARRHGVQGGRLQGVVIVFGDDQDAHQITLASFLSLSTSSATLPTMTPVWRLDGSSTFRVVSRGVTSTPSSSGLNTSMAFFFAFMMLGREA